MNVEQRLRELIDPHQHIAFLGKHFVNKFDEVVLKIGSKQWTRSDLIRRVGIANLSAAAKLNIVARKAHIQNMEQLYAVDPREMALTKGIGETTVFVAMALLQQEGFDVKHWYCNYKGAKERVVTFRTMKVWHRGRKQSKKSNRRYSNKGSL